MFQFFGSYLWPRKSSDEVGTICTLSGKFCKYSKRLEDWECIFLSGSTISILSQYVGDKHAFFFKVTRSEDEQYQDDELPFTETELSPSIEVRSEKVAQYSSFLDASDEFAISWDSPSLRGSPSCAWTGRILFHSVYFIFFKCSTRTICVRSANV